MAATHRVLHRSKTTSELHEKYAQDSPASAGPLESPAALGIEAEEEGETSTATGVRMTTTKVRPILITRPSNASSKKEESAVDLRAGSGSHSPCKEPDTDSVGDDLAAKIPIILDAPPQPSRIAPQVPGPEFLLPPSLTINVFPPRTSSNAAVMVGPPSSAAANLDNAYCAPPDTPPKDTNTIGVAISSFHEKRSWDVSPSPLLSNEMSLYAGRNIQFSSPQPRGVGYSATAYGATTQNEPVAERPSESKGSSWKTKLLSFGKFGRKGNAKAPPSPILYVPPPIPQYQPRTPPESIGQAISDSSSIGQPIVPMSQLMSKMPMFEDEEEDVNWEKPSPIEIHPFPRHLEPDLGPDLEPKRVAPAAPSLDLDIPTSKMERYSIMFGELLKPSPKSSLYARRMSREVASLNGETSERTKKEPPKLFLTPLKRNNTTGQACRSPLKFPASPHYSPRTPLSPRLKQAASKAVALASGRKPVPALPMSVSPTTEDAPLPTTPPRGRRRSISTSATRRRAKRDSDIVPAVMMVLSSPDSSMSEASSVTTISNASSGGSISHPDIISEEGEEAEEPDTPRSSILEEDEEDKDEDRWEIKMADGESSPILTRASVSDEEDAEHLMTVGDLKFPLPTPRTPISGGSLRVFSPATTGKLSHAPTPSPLSASPMVRSPPPSISVKSPPASLSIKSPPPSLNLMSPPMILSPDEPRTPRTVAAEASIRRQISISQRQLAVLGPKFGVSRPIAAARTPEIVVEQEVMKPSIATHHANSSVSSLLKMAGVKRDGGLSVTPLRILKSSKSTNDIGNSAPARR